MNTSLSESPAVIYQQYLDQICPTLTAETLARLENSLNVANWDEPESAIDLNNFAVIALIEAENCDDSSVRAIHVEMALEALMQGIDTHPDHPLCTAHLAVVRNMLGETQSATQIAFSTLLNILQPTFADSESAPMGLVYVPYSHSQTAIARGEQLQHLLQAKNGYTQAMLLLVDVLCRSQLVFYNSGGLRFLQLLAPLMPQAASLQLKLGLAQLMSKQGEGLLHLHQAQKLAPDSASALQALHLVYRNLDRLDAAEFWLTRAREVAAQRNPSDPGWQWAMLGADSPFTYVPFEERLLLTVEPNFRSIVTSVLLGESDWFEAEIEFWRSQLQQGMTVIDVGANVGVYTFSAAQQVGSTGRVLAVEPFSGCVQCLQETCRVNHLSQVTVCAGAASDRNGTARLSLHTASELNEVITEESGLPAGQYEEVACFTLDSLVEQHQLSRVDWLKIDAEGHEMQVLAGCDRILSEFAPGILYENIAGAKGSNTPVAEYLKAKGYQLFRYQPYLQDLIPIQSADDLQGNLNIIALPQR